MENRFPTLVLLVLAKTSHFILSLINYSSLPKVICYIVSLLSMIRSCFENAEEMVQFLEKYSTNDSSKEHQLVDTAETVSIRKNEREEFVLKPCRTFHVTAVNKHGKFGKILHYRNQDIFNFLFDDVSDIQEIIDDEQEEHAFWLNQDTIFELVEPGTFVGI